ncbi:MAG: Tim44/TimA family putative adaptor protein, partial [Rickettsiales bacterium]|nr:Tim44/TimA family putative adaptor protein [Rickettsiales bacterium]
MSEGIPYADIIILALVAGFILLRLRSVLGDKVGNDSPSYFNKPATPANERKEAIVQLDEKALKAKPRPEPDSYMAKVKDEEVIAGVNAIKAKDPEFLASYFLEGAKGAFEMVFDAFAKGDRDTLRFLLDKPVYEEFSHALESREAQPFKTDTTLISVQAKDIISASLTGNIARIAVKFASEQVTVTRDEAGEIVGGDASLINAIEDEWVFERDVTSRNPN